MAPQIAERCSRDRDRIDARMTPEAAVLGRDSGIYERRRQAICGDPLGPAAVAGARFVQHLAMAIDERCRIALTPFEQVGRQRADADPDGERRTRYGGYRSGG